MGTKKGRVKLTLPFLFLLSGRSTFCAEIGFGTPVTPIRANPLASRIGYEAAAPASASATSGINRDSFT
jgi:hypothetical protein